MTVVLVTGAAGGMGRAIARRLASQGHALALADLTADGLAEAALALPDGRVTTHVLDVTDDAACSAVIADVVAQHGGLDGLVNNAGIMVRRDALHTDTATWQHVLDVNLTGAFRMARAAHDALAAAPAGAIVSISSSHAVMAAKNSIAYSVSKAGISHLTRLLALEWADDGIRVNAVAPTVVATPMTVDVLADPAYVARKMAAIPLHRAVEADHVAGAVAYLLGPDAASTTGQILLLDGGESLA
jgi:NAD(P)-dependent dehydrogenase (short-subunit alcohol dehydrogenase family)